MGTHNTFASGEEKSHQAINEGRDTHEKRMMRFALNKRARPRPWYQGQDVYSDMAGNRLYLCDTQPLSMVHRRSAQWGTRIAPKKKSSSR